jgi:hypothetical protein
MNDGNDRAPRVRGVTFRVAPTANASTNSGFSFFDVGIANAPTPRGASNNNRS